jgi:hypothetical protein
MIVLLMHSVIIAHWFWHPLQNGYGYNFWSGPEPDIFQIAIIGTLAGLIKHLNCDAPRCLRYGPHRTADGHHKLCRTHHPDLPNHRLSLAEIHLRHHKAQTERTPVTSV